MSQPTLAALKKYTFPGNIRELRNIVEQAILMADDRIIEPSDLPEYVCASTQQTAHLSPQGEKDIMTLAEVEAHYLKDKVDVYTGNTEDLADALGISVRTLYRKLQALKINAP